MKELQFKVDIQAPKQKVWDILWHDETFRQWAGIIDPGTYMEGELKLGNEIQFISAEGYGVTSIVEKLIEGECLVLRHKADTQDSGARSREDEWTGGAESYALSEYDGKTQLKVTFDVPEHMEEYFRENYPKALAQIKLLSEMK